MAFTGDLIWGPGRIWEMYSLQKKVPGMQNEYVGFGWAYHRRLSRPASIASWNKSLTS